MKKVIIILALFAIISSSFMINDLEVKPNTTYLPGENLKYLLYYGIIDGGTATLSLKHVWSAESKKILHARAYMKTKGVADWVLGIEDVYESYFDDNNYCKPVRAIRNIKENSYRYYDEVVYHHDKNKVVSKKNGEVKVPANIYDIISSLYHMRRNKMNYPKLNDTITITTYFADEIFPYRVVFKGYETIQVKMGKYKAMKFQPIVEVGRAFKEQDDMRFWISADANRVPLRVEFDLFLGSLKCDLIEAQGLKTPLKQSN